MHIAKGQWRLIIALPEYGIVLKLPRIRLYWALRGLPNYVKSYKIWRKVTLQNRTLITPIGCLLRGLMENWSERRFYRQTKHRFLQPTLFSFFGFMNIQRYGKPLNGIGSLIANYFWDISKSGEGIRNDGHHFMNSQNFTKDFSGKLRMLDYGFKTTQEIIRKYGERLQDEFVFPAGNC